MLPAGPTAIIASLSDLEAASATLATSPATHISVDCFVDDEGRKTLRNNNDMPSDNGMR